jgi:hypothetical protein
MPEKFHYPIETNPQSARERFFNLWYRLHEHTARESLYGVIVPTQHGAEFAILHTQASGIRSRKEGPETLLIEYMCGNNDVVAIQSGEIARAQDTLHVTEKLDAIHTLLAATKS